MDKEDITVELSKKIIEEIEKRIKGGEFECRDDLAETAVRYYFQRHTSKDMASYVDEEISTGIEGSA